MCACDLVINVILMLHQAVFSYFTFLLDLLWRLLDNTRFSNSFSVKVFTMGFLARHYKLKQRNLDSGKSALSKYKKIFHIPVF